MNQTKKRLAIIKLAISLTDTETIQLQVLKLGMLRSDSRLREIIEMLEEKKYAQSQMLISSYIDAPTETTIIQRTPKDHAKDDAIIAKMQLSTEESIEKESLIKRSEETVPPQVTEKPLSLKEKIQLAKDKAIIDQFELFTETAKEPIEDTPQELDNYDAYLDTSPKPKKMSTTNINYDALLNVDAKDVLPNNITIDIQEEDKVSKPKILQKEVEQEEEMKENDNIFPTLENNEDENITILEEVEVEVEVDAEVDAEEDSNYKAIPYIDQKLKNMQKQYPVVHMQEETFLSVSTLLSEISEEGYSELGMEGVLKQIEGLSTQNKAEAAQLLLLVGGTESKYAQFTLARALFKGELLQKNLPESFSLIHRLATNEDYPEAICDLAQFYEKGIGTEKDTKRAQELYKEAMDLGIHRASEHYERMIKKDKGLLSIFKR